MNDTSPFAYPQTPAVSSSGDVYYPVDGYGPGMTLRDYFAAQAVTGLIASPDFLSPTGLFTGGGDDVMARAAYMIADAMLAERAKEGK